MLLEVGSTFDKCCVIGVAVSMLVVNIVQFVISFNSFQHWQTRTMEEIKSVKEFDYMNFRCPSANTVLQYNMYTHFVFSLFTSFAVAAWVFVPKKKIFQYIAGFLNIVTACCSVYALIAVNYYMYAECLELKPLAFMVYFVYFNELIVLLLIVSRGDIITFFEAPKENKPISDARQKSRSIAKNLNSSPKKQEKDEQKIPNFKEAALVQTPTDSQTPIVASADSKATPSKDTVSKDTGDQKDTATATPKKDTVPSKETPK